MDYTTKKGLLFLLVCWFSLKGCAAVVVTVPDNVTLWVDRPASLSCRATENPPSVSWTIGTNVLARWTTEDGIIIPNPDGKYNMTRDGQDFVLIINNLALSDAEDYICAAPPSEGQLAFGSTTVTVNDAPLEPFPSIEECPDDSDGDGDCHIDVFNETDTKNLTCMARHFFPNVTLTWSLRTVYIQPVNVDWNLNDDGTYSGGITINASPQDEAYVCTVTGEALRDVTTKLVRAVVQVPEASPTPDTTENNGGGDGDGPSSNNIGMIIGIVIAILFCVMFVLFLIYVWRVKGRERGTKDEYSYSDLAKNQGKSVEEDDERMARATKTTTGKDDNFGAIIDETEDDKKREKPKEEDTTEKSEKSPDPKVSVTVEDRGDHGGHGVGHTDHDHSHSSGGGGAVGGDGGGGGGGGGHSDHHDHSHSYSSSGGGGHSSGGGGGSSHDDHGGHND